MRNTAICALFSVIVSFLFICPNFTSADSLHLVKDINLHPPEVDNTWESIRNPESLIVGDRLYFNNFDPVHGLELWISDGTASGTRLVKDIEPGILSSWPQSLTAVGNVVYFTAYQVRTGRELWKTDGTTAGTVLVKDICPGKSGADPGQLVNLKGSLFFAASDGLHGVELWKSDGTVSGTIMVRDIRPGTASSGPSCLTAFQGIICFAADDGTSTGMELWRSDGTSSGTRLVKDCTPNGSTWITSIKADASALFLSSYPSSSSSVLWRSDGTAGGTTEIKQFSPGRIGSMTLVNGRLYFTCPSSVLWEYDGSNVNQIGRLYKTNPSGRENLHPSGGYFGYLTACGKDLYYIVNANLLYRYIPAKGSQHIWLTPYLYPPNIDCMASDGTRLFVAMGSSAYCLKDDSITSIKIPNVSFFKGKFLKPGQSRVFMYGLEDFRTWGLWLTDATAAGTYRISDVYPGSAGSSSNDFVQSQGKLFFSATDDVHGGELWKSDGTSLGTAMVKDLCPGSGGSWPQDITNINRTLFFSAADGTHGTELFKSDGTEAGTGMVKDIYPGASNSSYPEYIFSYNNKYYFCATDGRVGYELWQSDGTALGTRLLKDFTAGAADSFFNYIGEVAGKAFLYAGDGVNSKLWRTDGTTSGTVVVSGIPKMDQTCCVGNRLYFRSTGAQAAAELWVTDGTSIGTTLLKSFGSGSLVLGMSAWKNMLFFSAGSSVEDMGLWKSDGTPGGTTLIKKLYPGKYYDFSNIVELNNQTFFKVELSGGFEIWKTDGSSSGTQLVAGGFHYPGDGSYLAESRLVPLGNQIYFTNTTTDQGTELWSSDGTAAGTRMVMDLNLGPGNACPNNFMVYDGRLFFTATDGNIGRELWMYDPQDVRILFPNGSETFKNRSIIEVIWNTNLQTVGSAVRIELWRGDNRVATLGSFRQPEGNGRSTVSLPNVLPGVDYRIRAVSPANERYLDFSDHTFSIVSNTGVQGKQWNNYQ